jgi:FkbM family methyltransferase
MLTRDHVIWAYRLFLDREPENDFVIDEKVNTNRGTQELRSNFMLSPEFGENNPNMVMFNERNIVIKELPDGLRLFVDTADVFIGWAVIRGGYEVNEINFARRTIRPGQTVLDIGANVGVFTVTMAGLVGPTGKVYAFEPLEKLASLLERSIKENTFGDRVVLERAAVSDTAGRAQLVSAAKTINEGGAYLRAGESEVPRGHNLTDVPLLTLDSYSLRRPVHFIKIDIEGAEPLALRGAKRLLQEDRPVILSELHPTQLMRVSGCTPTEFVTEIESYGYKCWLLKGEKLVDFTVSGDEVNSIVFMPAS